MRLLAVWISARPAAPGEPAPAHDVDALRQFPGYFHLQNVLVRGEFVERGTELVLEPTTRTSTSEPVAGQKRGPVEVRGQLIDVGRLERGDSRLGTYAERRGRRNRGRRPGAELLLNVTGVIEAQLAATPSVRALALEPWKFERTERHPRRQLSRTQPLRRSS